VPTILVLDKNKKTKGLWNGGIALKLKITKQDIQDHIDKLIAQEAANLSRRRSTN
jgi:predicted ArsR family transcriptional regulator